MKIDYKTPLLTGADVCTCKANSVLNDGVCELQYRTDLWIIFQVVQARYSDQPEIVTALMEKFASFATVADFAPIVASPTGVDYQLPLIVSLRKVFIKCNPIYCESKLLRKSLKPPKEKRCLKSPKLM